MPKAIRLFDISYGWVCVFLQVQYNYFQSTELNSTVNKVYSSRHSTPENEFLRSKHYAISNTNFGINAHQSAASDTRSKVSLQRNLYAAVACMQTGICVSSTALSDAINSARMDRIKWPSLFVWLKMSIEQSPSDIRSASQ